MTEFDADEPYQNPSGIIFLEQFQGFFNQNMIGGSIGYPALKGVGFEIGIAYFKGDTARNPPLGAQLETKLVYHHNQGVAQNAHVGSVLMKSFFRTHAFLLAVGFYRCKINGIALAPNTGAIFTKCSL